MTALLAAILPLSIEATN